MCDPTTSGGHISGKILSRGLSYAGTIHVEGSVRGKGGGRKMGVCDPTATGGHVSRHI